MTKQNTSQRKNALGRGLNALLEDTAFLASEGVINPLREIPTEQIAVNPFQPRRDFNHVTLRELHDSIKLHGVIQPITVRKIASSSYQIIAGERRLQAAKMAGMMRIPAYVRIADDQQMLEIALVENIQRENLNPIEIALSYQRLLHECRIKLETLGARVGKNRATVNNYLRLLKLPPAIQVALRDHKISMGHARALINVASVEVQLRIFQEITENNLSVRSVEELVRGLSRAGSSRSSQKSQSESKSKWKIALRSTGNQLAARLGAQVKIRVDGKDSGEIRIAFTDVGDLHRILEILIVD